MFFLLSTCVGHSSLYFDTLICLLSISNSFNKNERDVQKKCCKQCGQVKFMGTMTKWPVQKHTEHHKTQSIQRRKRHKETTFFVFFVFF